MNLLLVNNSSTSFTQLETAVATAGYSYTSCMYNTIGSQTVTNFDAVILSGGWWYDDYAELQRQYGDELQLIRDCPVPILGICIGMQLMHVALEGDVPLLDEPIDGYRTISVNTAGQAAGLPSQMRVYKLHTRGVVQPDPSFNTLATSPGHVEILRHTSKPLLGVQFHPEINESPAAAGDSITQLLGLLFPLLRERQ